VVFFTQLASNPGTGSGSGTDVTGTALADSMWLGAGLLIVALAASFALPTRSAAAQGPAGDTAEHGATAHEVADSR